MDRSQFHVPGAAAFDSMISMRPNRSTSSFPAPRIPSLPHPMVVVTTRLDAQSSGSAVGIEERGPVVGEGTASPKKVEGLWYRNIFRNNQLQDAPSPWEKHRPLEQLNNDAFRIADGASRGEGGSGERRLFERGVAV